MFTQPSNQTKGKTLASKGYHMLHPPIKSMFLSKSKKLMLGNGTLNLRLPKKDRGHLIFDTGF